jgi:benzodiazapine receptor
MPGPMRDKVCSLDHRRNGKTGNGDDDPARLNRMEYSLARRASVPYVRGMSKALTYLVFIAIALGGGLAIGINNLPGEWYQSLAKPPFNPPNWIFGPAWSILYVLIGIAGARTWMRGHLSVGMLIWAGQMVVNFLWSPFFFGLQMPPVALAIIVVLWVLILAFIANRWNADRIAAWLFLPYLAWVSFATLLNGSIVYLN